MQYKFIIEKYKDPNETLYQAFEIPCYMGKEEFYKYRAFIRTQVNPNLTWMYEITYLDKNRKVLYWDLFDIDGKFIKRDEPWSFDSNKRKYKAGLIPDRNLEGENEKIF